ncbi:hypothetical protein K1T71_006523 [Dendrolimus kikuchii]|uniref:Uncharacterized protein n=1 Tax=Dendrolimus kikuchii TaxID=765133 RepID=A0ACC1D1N1_9NEOP|nr:hypothetical protein K1T71_006523 [Dendrolimus kikuchii]
MAHFILALTIVILLVTSQGVSAKRGCSAFGHSCFGGHGKRSGDSNPMDMTTQEIGRHQLGEEETPPHPIYPHSGYNNVLQPGDDIIPVRDGGAYDRDETTARELMKLKLRNIVKHWMDNYRRSQENSEDGYYFENI